MIVGFAALILLLAGLLMLDNHLSADTLPTLVRNVAVLCIPGLGMVIVLFNEGHSLPAADTRR